MTSKKQITYRLSTAMMESGKTQRQVAEEIDACTTLVNGYVTGPGHMPGAERLAQLCKALHVSADWVLGLQEAPALWQQWEQDICRAALQKYGIEHQRLMLFEEMAELQNAICKERRGRDSKEHIAEEIADVEIMLEQMKVYYSIHEEVGRKRREKLERLRERMCSDGLGT